MHHRDSCYSNCSGISVNVLFRCVEVVYRVSLGNYPGIKRDLLHHIRATSTLAVPVVRCAVCQVRLHWLDAL